MIIEESIKLDFKDVLIRPKRSELKTRKEVDLKREFIFHHSKHTYKGIPIIAANMDTIGTISMAKVLSEFGMMVSLHKHYPIEKLKEVWGSSASELEKFCFYTMGITDADEEKYQEFAKIAPKNRHFYLCIDVANGYTERFVDFIKKKREQLPNVTIMAGNVVTGEMTEQLILAGADIVKVGIGSGSVCTTRAVTGVGYPQLSAIIECADAAHGLGGNVCADGGCQVPGDIVKAFGAGSDFVMLGGMLSGHDECEGHVFETTKNGSTMQAMMFYGMSSEEAMDKYSGGVAAYRASEGKVVEVPYRGPVMEMVQQVLGGLRSACTYIGARRLKELPKRTTFIRVSQQLNPMFGG